MATDQEVERLEEVYRQYRESDTIRVQWSETNPGNRAIVGERTRMLAQMLRRAGLLPLANRRILDIGCGSGKVLGSFLQSGALPENLYGIDLLPDRIEAAKQNFPDIHFQQANAEQLDFRDASFDLVLLFTVFTSILDDRMARAVAEEVRRVLRAGGAVVWYDFRYNNPRNRHVRGMTKDAIGALFPDFALHLRPTTVLPPLARRLGVLTPVLYPALSTIPFLRTHYLGLLVKPR